MRQDKRDALIEKWATRMNSKMGTHPQYMRDIEALLSEYEDIEQKADNESVRGALIGALAGAIVVIVVFITFG